MAQAYNPGDNIGPNLEAAALSTALIALVVVGARFWARSRVVKALGIDDWFMLLALVLAFVSVGTEFYSAEQGFGRHIKFVPKAKIPVIFKYVGISGAFCNMALTFAKLSIIATIMRILRGTHERLTIMCLYGFGLTILAVNVVVTGTQYGQCHPIERVWNKSVPGSCWNPKIQSDLSYLQGAYSAFSDFVLALLPIIILRHLKLSKGLRNALLFVMGLGTVTGALAIARTVQTWRYSGVNDSTYTTVTLLMLSALERNFAIIFGSVPQCAPLLRNTRLFSSLHSPTRTFTAGGSPSSGTRTTVEKSPTLEKSSSTSLQGTWTGDSVERLDFVTTAYKEHGSV